ncbi:MULTISPECIES: hypothetical protein [Microbulbifer]|uniref:Uncharacterized protein n=1 Tax=Microbulbifer celer TaxID=435905 RepID=A0ABW3UDK3_9GAMM|nr:MULTISPECIES: hypothetical protein [Microbulbifer]UFN59075.1 hypothetical protein LPW13_08575 [Microbulbifer celer]
MQSLLEQVGGHSLINRTVAEFYQVIGKHLSDFESGDHERQCSRQAQFLLNALSHNSEALRSGRANFLARGLNPDLFESLLEYLEGRLAELGFSPAFSEALVRTVSDLYNGSDEPLAIAC